MAAACSAGLALAALVGWIIGAPALTALAPDQPTMKFNAAIGMLALAIAVATLTLDALPAVRAVRGAACAVAIAIGALALGQDLLGIDLGVDEWLMLDRFTPPGAAAPGRAAAVTALSMVLLGVGALWSAAGSTGAAARWRPVPAVLSFVLGYVASIGLLFGAEWDRSVGHWFATVSLSSAASIVLLSAALTVQLPWRGTLFEPLASASAGGKLLRGALPLALVAPGAVIWVEDLSRRNGWWPTQVGLVVTVLLLAGGLLMVVAYSARWLDRLESDLQSERDTLEQHVHERTTELAASHRQLSHSRQQLAGIVQTAAAAIITVDARQSIVVFNAEAERVFGYSAATVLGRPMSILLPQRVRDVHEQRVANFAQTGQTFRPMGGTAELRGLRADGEEFPISASIAKTGEGSRALMTVVLRDLSEAQALERERTAREAAEAVVRAKDMFLSRVSHELRTPLNAVSGLSQLLQMSPGAMTEQQRRHVNLIGGAARQLDMLVGDLLDLGASSYGRLVLRRDPVDIWSVVREAESMATLLASEAGVALHGAAPRDGELACIASGEHGRVVQIVLNLLTNAIKYNRPGGRVDVEVRRAERCCEVLVRDSGQGLDAEQRAHLFEPFNRLGRERANVEGRGLGLTLSQSLAKAMGGRIDVSSEPGVGSEFKLVLPAHGV